MASRIAPLVLLFALGTGGCSGTAECAAGARRACACGAVSGAQSCSSVGTWGICDCRTDAGLGDAGRALQDAATDAGGDAAVDAPSARSASATLGPEGGSLVLGDARIEVPPGALDTPTLLTLTETTRPGPPGYSLESPLYELAPEGLAFAMPVHVTLPLTVGDPARAALFWSRPAADGGGYERIHASELVAGAISGSVHHFSEGFAADGVDFTETADPSCTQVEVGTRSRTIGAAAASFLRVHDCWGRPIGGLAHDAIDLSPPLAHELHPATNDAATVLLFLDFGDASPTEAATVIAHAEQFVREIESPRHTRRLALGIFWAGGTRPVEMLPLRDGVTLDAESAIAAIETLRTTLPPSLGRTDLGAEMRTAMSRFDASTHLVVLGSVTAGGLTVAQAESMGIGPRLTYLANEPGLVGSEVTAPLANATLIEPTAGTWDRELAFVAAHIVAAEAGSYLMTTCGLPTTGAPLYTSLQVSGATLRDPVDLTREAIGTRHSACWPSLLVDPCDGRCGLGICGGCAAGETCDLSVASCVPACTTRATCAATTQVGTDLGETVSCDAWGSCHGSCVDLQSDLRHCGACDHACTFACGEGSCLSVSVLGETFVAGHGVDRIVRGGPFMPMLDAPERAWIRTDYVESASPCVRTASGAVRCAGMPLFVDPVTGADRAFRAIARTVTDIGSAICALEISGTLFCALPDGSSDAVAVATNVAALADDPSDGSSQALVLAADGHLGRVTCTSAPFACTSTPVASGGVPVVDATAVGPSAWMDAAGRLHWSDRTTPSLTADVFAASPTGSVCASSGTRLECWAPSGVAPTSRSLGAATLAAPLVDLQPYDVGYLLGRTADGHVVSVVMTDPITVAELL